MAQLQTFRCWYRDGSARLVCAENESAARIEAEKRAKEYYADAYFATTRERNLASKVQEIENLDA